METAYGNVTAVPSGADLVGYLEWARAERRSAREVHVPAKNTR
jgi:hypothetical protein